MKDKLREDRRDAIAKAIADCIGHGMREKCERHADAVLAILDAKGDGGANVPTFDLDAMAWEQIKKAASESEWIPSEYMANDWHYDVCEYLRKGAPAHPARPGVVSDEDVATACRKYYNCGHPGYPPVFEGMRAALEHFVRNRK